MDVSCPACGVCLSFLQTTADPAQECNGCGAEVALVKSEDEQCCAFETERAADKIARLRAELEKVRAELVSHHNAASNLRLPVADGHGARPQWSDGGPKRPRRGWHYVFDGSGFSYTMPAAGPNGDLGWWVLENPDGHWLGHQSLAARIVSTVDGGDSAQARTESIAVRVAMLGREDLQVNIRRGAMAGWVAHVQDAQVVSQWLGVQPGEALDSALGLNVENPAIPRGLEPYLVSAQVRMDDGDHLHVLVYPPEDLPGVWAAHMLDADIFSQAWLPGEALDFVLEAWELVPEEYRSRPAPAEAWDRYCAAVPAPSCTP